MYYVQEGVAVFPRQGMSCMNHPYTQSALLYSYVTVEGNDKTGSYRVDQMPQSKEPPPQIWDRLSRTLGRCPIMSINAYSHNHQ